MYLGEAGRKAYMDQQSISDQLNQAQAHANGIQGQVSNCLQPYFNYQYNHTPAVGIDRASNGWIVTVGGYVKYVASTFDDLCAILNAQIGPK